MTHLPRQQLAIWQSLVASAKSVDAIHLKSLADDSARAAALFVESAHLHIDFSKQKITLPIVADLIRLAQACGLPTAIHHLFNGMQVNTTEQRSALHTALRLPAHESLLVDGTEINALVQNSLKKMGGIVNQIHSKQWRGYTGRAITDVVNIGVGGSDLGPFMTSFALDEFKIKSEADLTIHFVSSIDGSQLSHILPTLDHETTLFIISSKSFTTQDTLANAETALQWLLSKTKQKNFILQHHFIGVSTNSELMSTWGIPEQNQLLFWEWIGGRYSLWSAIGLPLAIKIGMPNFYDMLAGAHALDEHFKSAPFDKNLPVLMGLMGVWNASFLNIQAHSVLPYDGRLKHFPAYLSQLEMESNGKSVDLNNTPITYGTCPILWGDVGPNAQHAFYQLLHQGTQAVSCDFIAPISYTNAKSGQTKEEQKQLKVQHQLTLANLLAQSRSLMLGDAAIASAPTDTPKYKRYQGDKPSTTILMDALTPASLGALIALYEHKVYVMSVIWNINPFDQWGVQLGKVIADDMMLHLSNHNHAPLTAVDASTAQLLNLIQRKKVKMSKP